MTAKLLILGFLAALVTATVPANADIPDPSPSLIPPVLTVSPDGSIGYSVQIVGTKGAPIAGAVVEVVFDPEVEALLPWCSGQVHPTVTAVTNTYGEATLYISGGGCIDEVPSTGLFIAQVRVDGIVLAELDAVNSPDITDSSGRRVTDYYYSKCEGGETTVGLADAVEHTQTIAYGLQDVCSKFSAPYDEPVGLADAVVITAFVTAGTTCTCGP